MSKRPVPLERKVLDRMLEGTWDARMLSAAVGIKLEEWDQWMEEHDIWRKYRALRKLDQLNADHLATQHRVTAVTRLLSLVSQGKGDFTDREMETIRKACGDVLRLRTQDAEKRARSDRAGDRAGMEGVDAGVATTEEVLEALRQLGEVKHG